MHIVSERTLVQEGDARLVAATVQPDDGPAEDRPLLRRDPAVVAVAHDVEGGRIALRWTPSAALSGRPVLAAARRRAEPQPLDAEVAGRLRSLGCTAADHRVLAQRVLVDPAHSTARVTLVRAAVAEAGDDPSVAWFPVERIRPLVLGVGDLATWVGVVGVAATLAPAGPPVVDAVRPPEAGPPLLGEEPLPGTGAVTVLERRFPALGEDGERSWSQAVLVTPPRVLVIAYDGRGGMVVVDAPALGAAGPEGEPSPAIGGLPGVRPLRGEKPVAAAERAIAELGGRLANPRAVSRPLLCDPCTTGRVLLVAGRVDAPAGGRVPWRRLRPGAKPGLPLRPAAELAALRGAGDLDLAALGGLAMLPMLG